MVIRNTTQRIKIMEYLKSVKTHPNAETVYKHVKKELPSITLATVYRNLNLLAKHGKILRLEINGEYHYDADTSYHQHCVCNRCGKIINLMQENISRYAMKKCRCNEFQPSNVNIIFNGTCSKCRGDA